MSPLFTMIFYVFDLFFDFWFLIVLAPLIRRRGNFLNNIFFAWLLLVIIRVFLFFNPEPLPSLTLPDPENTILFFSVGAGLILVRKFFN